MNKKTHHLFLILLISLAIMMSSCKNEVDEPAVAPELPEDTESLVLLAKFDLVLRIGADIEDITTKSIEQTLFNDPSLGVPQEGAEYEAVVTPGYIIILELDGESYEYHASGAKVVMVPKPE